MYYIQERTDEQRTDVPTTSSTTSVIFTYYIREIILRVTL